MEASVGHNFTAFSVETKMVHLTFLDHVALYTLIQSKLYSLTGENFQDSITIVVSLNEKRSMVVSSYEYIILLSDCMDQVEWQLTNNVIILNCHAGSDL